MAAACEPEQTVMAVVVVEFGRQTPPITRCGCLIGGEQHSGDMRVHFVSALRGCRRSGDRARLNKGELGSDDFVRTNPVFLLPAVTVWTTGKEPPGL